MDNVGRGEKARQIAHSYVGWAVGAGLIPFPLADVGSLVLLQVKMLTDIARIYEVPLGRERARTLVMSTLGGLAPQSVAVAGIPALLKFVPVFGTLLGIAIMPAAAATSTLALAEIFIRHIEAHGRIPDRGWPRLTDSQPTPPELPPAPPSMTEPPSPPQPATTQPTVTEEPAADAEAVGDTPSDDTTAIASTDEHTTQPEPEEPDDHAAQPDTEAEQPVPRRRASTRRRPSPAEKS